MADELRYETRSRGLARMLGGGRSAVSAFVTGLLGAGAFVASLLADWQTVTFRSGSFLFGSESGEAVTLTAGVDVAGYVVPYQLGVLGLLALVGAVVAQPDLALRLRMATAGLGLGVAGVLVAIVFNLRDSVMRQLFGGSRLGGLPIPADVQTALDDAIYAAGPGVYLGFGAVGALVASVWLAAGSPRGAQAGGVATVAAPASPPAVEAPSDPTPDAAAPVSPSPVGPPGLRPDGPSGAASWPPARAGYAGGLTVTSSDATDPGGQADILRN